MKTKLKQKFKRLRKTMKAKIKSKLKSCLFIALGFALCGCATSDPASRMTTAEYGDITVVIRENVTNATVKITLGDGAMASADSSGSTESITASPTNSTTADVPINRSGASEAVDTAANLVKTAVDCVDCKE